MDKDTAYHIDGPVPETPGSGEWPHPWKETKVVGTRVPKVDAYERVSGTAVYPHDVFTGSVFEFRSKGYNRLGVVDFSQILVPIGEPVWASLSRRHYPQAGDEDGVTAGEVLGTATLSGFISSSGVQASPFAVLHYEPAGSAIDQLPAPGESGKHRGKSAGREAVLPDLASLDDARQRRTRRDDRGLQVQLVGDRVPRATQRADLLLDRRRRANAPANLREVVVGQVEGTRDHSEEPAGT